jgi:5'(3')-deoxyribonucleotidase
MRLGIDLDGVVADFNRGWMDRYNRDFGTSLSPDQVVTWDAMIDLSHFEDMGDFWAWANLSDDLGLFRDLPLYPEAKPSLDRLAQNHEIVIITTKPPGTEAHTFEWIGEHRIPTREVHITGEKWRVDCDVYLDDGPHNLELLVRERPDRTTCRFVRPWNHPIHGAIDIHDWDEFVTLVERRYC